jgi:hypothetical protein
LPSCSTSPSRDHSCHCDTRVYSKCTRHPPPTIAGWTSVTNPVVSRQTFQTPWSLTNHLTMHNLQWEQFL